MIAITTIEIDRNSDIIKIILMTVAIKNWCQNFVEHLIEYFIISLRKGLTLYLKYYL